jgi:spore coat polysaccharide biosynthesis protein SpsF
VKVVALIQARMGSTRLPGKVLMDLAGQPMLARVVERARRASRVDEVVVATSTLPGDDAIEALCRARGWACFRGSEGDVLDRYYHAARAHEADVVVRVTADCPLLDPELVDDVVAALLADPGHQYASNVHPRRTYPRGLDCEAMRAGALARAWREASAPVEREHVTPYLWHQPELFLPASAAGHEDHSSERWTVDTPEDLELVRRLYGALGEERLGWTAALEALEGNPAWRGLNAAGEQKTA